MEREREPSASASGSALEKRGRLASGNPGPRAGSMASGNPGPRLWSAAEAGDAQLVARLLGEGRDVNEADEFGCTALILASEKGHVDVVRLLLARQGVEVDKTEENG